MRFISLILISAGLLIIATALRKNPVSLKSLLDEYVKSILVHANIINILFLYAVFPFFLYVADPLGIKFFTVSINTEVLAYYLLGITHMYLVKFSGYSIFAALAFAVVSDTVLFAASSLLSLMMFKGWKAVLLNIFLFYLVLIALNLLAFY